MNWIQTKTFTIRENVYRIKFKSVENFKKKIKISNLMNKFFSVNQNYEIFFSI